MLSRLFVCKVNKVEGCVVLHGNVLCSVTCYMGQQTVTFLVVSSRFILALRSKAVVIMHSIP